MRAITECLRGVITIKRYANPHLPLPFTLSDNLTYLQSSPPQNGRYKNGRLQVIYHIRRYQLQSHHKLKTQWVTLSLAKTEVLNYSLKQKLNADRKIRF